MEFAHLRKSVINLHNTKIKMDKTGRYKIRALFYNSPFTWTRGIPLQNREIFIFAAGDLERRLQKTKKTACGLWQKITSWIQKSVQNARGPKKSSRFLTLVLKKILASDFPIPYNGKNAKRGEVG